VPARAPCWPALLCWRADPSFPGGRPQVDAFFNAKEVELLQLLREYAAMVSPSPHACRVRCALLFLCCPVHASNKVASALIVHLDGPRQVKEIKVERCRVACATQEDLLAAYEGTDMGDLIENFGALTAKVETLRHFVMLNLQAVIKITKKHDKHSDINLQSDIVQQVHDRNFFKSQLFGTLIMDIEVLAMELMLRLTGASDLAKNPALSDDSQCPTCMQQLCNPIMLPCGHRFCMRCVSPASYFKKGYRCPVCQQEHTLDVETVKYGPLLSPGSLPLHSSMPRHLSTSAPGNSATASRHLRNQPGPIQDTEGAHARQNSPGLGPAGRTFSILNQTRNSPHVEIDFMKLEREMSKRLLARERYRGGKNEVSPLADLSQVCSQPPCPRSRVPFDVAVA
jgi:hypothetical protein